MYFQVMIGVGSWLEQPVGQWAHTGALSQPCCAQSSGRMGRGALSPCENSPSCPAFFLRYSFSIFHREGTGKCCATLQAPVRKQEQKYSFLNTLHSTLVWSVSPRCVVIASTPVFVYTTKVSIPYEDYHGKSQHLLRP